MQDRYAGDVGDFLKYGLLRQLVAPDGGDPPLRLGVVWYRTHDESHNDDGKHVTYLEPANRVSEALRPLDTDLHDRMRTLLMLERSVAEVQRSGALPNDTRFFPDLLTFDDMPSHREVRLEARRRWLDAALDAVEGCEVVFADPDNGIRPADHSTGRHRAKSEKHAYVDELAEFARRGQAIVVYHHADRSAPVAEQIGRRLDDLAAEALRPIAAVRASRGTTRLFLIAGDGAVEDRLRRRLTAIERSPWHRELEVVWHQPDAVGPSTGWAPLS